MTRMDIPADRREKIAALLNASLASALDLSLATKQAHWNVKGPTFIALHQLFDQLHTNVEAHVDEIAERVTSLGHQAKGTLQTASAASSLTAFPADMKDGAQLTQALAERFAGFAKQTRAAIDEATGLGDAVTADLFTGVTAAVDKDLWFLEAHLNR